MESCEELKRKAKEQLEKECNHANYTPMLRGIGYALLALAVTIKNNQK